jgi:hypothetical protein
MRHYSICDSFCPGVVMWCPLRAPPLSSLAEASKSPPGVQDINIRWHASSHIVRPSSVERPIRGPGPAPLPRREPAWRPRVVPNRLRRSPSLSQSIALKLHPITRHPPLVLTITSVPVRCTALSRSANLEVWGGSSCVQLSRGCGQASTCPGCAACFLRGMRQCCTPFHGRATQPAV